MKSEVETLLELIKSRGYTRLIFDMDCTITRLELPWREHYKQIVQKLLPDIAKSFLTSLRDPSQSWGQTYNTHIDMSAEFEEIISKESPVFEASNLKHRPYDELIEMIKSLPASITYCLWSSNARDTTSRILKELDLNRVDVVVSRDDVRYLKPHPEGWALIDNGTPKSQYLFIGDSSNDRLVAEAIGIDYYPIRFFRK